MKQLAQVRIVEEYKPPLSKLTDVGSLVSTLLANAHILAGVLMLVLLVFGGLNMIIGAGQDDPQKTAQGKKAVTWAVAGFLIIFSSYWIIVIVENLTGIDILRR